MRFILGEPHADTRGSLETTVEVHRFRKHQQKYYRRMNVAITRAKEQLFVIGDSATVGADPFYNAFLTYIEKHGNYRTVWEFET
jgi:hypothetical protein